MRFLKWLFPDAPKEKPPLYVPRVLPTAAADLSSYVRILDREAKHWKCLHRNSMEYQLARAEARLAHWVLETPSLEMLLAQVETFKPGWPLWQREHWKLGAAALYENFRGEAAGSVNV